MFFFRRENDYANIDIEKVPDNKWHHFALAWSIPSDFMIYFDGTWFNPFKNREV